MSLFKVLVPVGSTRPFTEQVDLDGKNYNLRFRFNSRDGKWRLTILFESVVLVRGVSLVETDDLLRQAQHIEDIPAGTFSVRDLDSQGRDPDGTTFGDRVILLYESAA